MYLTWLNDIVSIMKYMPEAIIVGILLCVSASIIGVILVLKRYSMIGDGLSHVGFGAFSLALAFNTILEMHDKGLKKEGWELLIAIPIVIVAAYVLLNW